MAQQITLYFHEGIGVLSRCVLHVKGELARNNHTDPWCEIVGKLPVLPLRIVLIASESLGALP